MDSNFQHIQSLIAQSDLHKEDQDNLMALYAQAGDDDLAPIAELFAEDSSWIRKISENLKTKQSAFAGKNKMAWIEILKGEETLLQDLVKEK
jgi:hypothetical protein